MHPSQNCGEEGAFWAAEPPRFTAQGCATITGWGSRRDSSAGFLVPLMKSVFGNEQQHEPACLNWHI